MQANSIGICPGIAKGRRVRVKLGNGSTFEAPADGKFGVRWQLNKPPHPFDIAEWEVV